MEKYKTSPKHIIRFYTLQEVYDLFIFILNRQMK